eukprot:SAG31_NODE_1606_length_7761_cov_4.493996_3_plen_238_part_00
MVGAVPAEREQRYDLPPVHELWRLPPPEALPCRCPRNVLPPEGDRAVAQRPLPLPARCPHRPTLATGVLPGPAPPAAAAAAARTTLAPGPACDPRHHRQVPIETAGVASGARPQGCYRSALLQQESSHLGLQALDRTRPNDRRASDDLLGNGENAAGNSALQHEWRELGGAGGAPRAERVAGSTQQQNRPRVVDPCAARRDGAPERRLLLHVPLERSRPNLSRSPRRRRRSLSLQLN